MYNNEKNIHVCEFETIYKFPSKLATIIQLNYKKCVQNHIRACKSIKIQIINRNWMLFKYVYLAKWAELHEIWSTWKEYSILYTNKL